MISLIYSFLCRVFIALHSSRLFFVHRRTYCLKTPLIVPLKRIILYTLSWISYPELLNQNKETTTTACCFRRRWKPIPFLENVVMSSSLFSSSRGFVRRGASAAFSSFFLLRNMILGFKSIQKYIGRLTVFIATNVEKNMNEKFIRIHLWRL